MFVYVFDVFFEKTNIFCKKNKNIENDCVFSSNMKMTFLSIVKTRKKIQNTAHVEIKDKGNKKSLV